MRPTWPNANTMPLTLTIVWWAAELERRWEAKLQALAATQREVEQFEQRPSPAALTPQLRQQFQTICDNLPAIWAELANQEKKSLLRSLIERVILTPSRSGPSSYPCGVGLRSLFILRSTRGHPQNKRPPLLPGYDGPDSPAVAAGKR